MLDQWLDMNTWGVILALRLAPNCGENCVPMQRWHNFCVNDVIYDKNVVTKIMSKYTGLQHIGFNSFAKLHWQNGYFPVAYVWCLGLC